MTDETPDPVPPPDVRFRRVRIEVRVPDGMASHWSNFTAVQGGADDLVLNFCEVHSPPVLGSPEEVKGQLEAIDIVPAWCVARIVMSRRHIPGLIDALQKQYDLVQGSGVVVEYSNEP